MSRDQRQQHHVAGIAFLEAVEHRPVGGEQEQQQPPLGSLETRFPGQEEPTQKDSGDTQHEIGLSRKPDREKPEGREQVGHDGKIDEAVDTTLKLEQRLQCRMPFQGSAASRVIGLAEIGEQNARLDERL